ncbi:MAG: NAD(P)-dependent oxidoreductase [bacterium]
MPALPRIGFIGLGIMGSAMVKNLRCAGYRVTVYNRDRAKIKPLEAFGCDSVTLTRDLAGRTNIVITMVTDDAALDAVLEGPTGWFAGPVTGQTLINMSTVSVSCTKKLAEKCLKAGARFLDCPVTGSKVQAESAQLIILTGGDSGELEKARPLLLKMGKTVIHAGSAGSGTALKLCLNLIVAQMTTALAESTVLASEMEIDPSLLFEVLHESPALDCGYFRIKEKNLLEASYEPAFSLRNMLKDIRFMLDEAGKRGLEIPVTAAAGKLMKKALLGGHGDMDLSIIAETLRKEREKIS